MGRLTKANTNICITSAYRETEAVRLLVAESEIKPYAKLRSIVVRQKLFKENGKADSTNGSFGS